LGFVPQPNLPTV